jgi:hypothetical protein
MVKSGDKVPISYLKDEEDPIIMSRSEYPSWVWNLPSSTSPTLTDLVRKEGVGDFNDLTLWEQRRYLQLAQRKNIKEQVREGWRRSDSSISTTGTTD